MSFSYPKDAFCYVVTVADVCARASAYVNTSIWVTHVHYQNKIILPLFLDIKLPVQFVAERGLPSLEVNLGFVWLYESALSP